MNKEDQIVLNVKKTGSVKLKYYLPPLTKGNTSTFGAKNKQYLMNLYIICAQI